MHADLHDTHHRSHEQPVTQQQSGERGRTERGCPQGENHEINGDQGEPHDRKHRGQPGLVDQLAGHQRTGADSDGERNQQETGGRRRSPTNHFQIDGKERDQGHESRAVAGSHCVAVPNGRLAQQAERNERRRHPVLVAYQQHQRDEAGREQAAPQRQGAEIDVLDLLQREQRRRNEHREQN